MMLINRLPNFGGRPCTVRCAAVTFYSKGGGSTSSLSRHEEKTNGRKFPAMVENIRVSTQPFRRCGSMMTCYAPPNFGCGTPARRGGAGTLHPLGGVGTGAIFGTHGRCSPPAAPPGSGHKRVPRPRSAVLVRCTHVDGSPTEYGGCQRTHKRNVRRNV